MKKRFNHKIRFVWYLYKVLIIILQSFFEKVFINFHFKILFPYLIK